MAFLKKVAFRGGRVLFVSTDPTLARLTRVVGEQTGQLHLSLTLTLTLALTRYNAECRAIVMRYSGEWQKTVKRIGRWIEFDTGYF